MYKSFAVLFGIVTILFITSRCKHDADEIPTPSDGNSNNNNSNNLNVKDSICYLAEIQPVFNTYCAYSGCHDAASARSGVDLSSYSSTKKVDGNSLIESIDAKGGDRMPPINSTALPAAKNSLIKQWIKEGMKDNVDCSLACDTGNVTFSGTVFSIIRDNCNGCHNNTSPILSSYAGIKVQADNGKLVCSIDHASGCSAMPPSLTKISDCNINQIKKWIALGAKND